MASQPIWRKRLLTLVKAGVSLSLLALLYSRIDFHALAGQLASIRPLWLALAFALMGVNTLVSSMKWRILLRADRIDQPLGSLFASHLIGSFFNLFLPSTIGGDAYRIADIGQRTDNHARTAASILVDRITGFLALALFGLVAPFVVRDSIPNWDHRLLLFPAVALVALCGLAFALCEGRILRRICSWLPGKVGAKCLSILDSILGSVQAYIGKARVVIQVLALSFVFQLCVILAVWAIVGSLGLGLAPWPFFFFVPLITLIEMIPVSVFGIGLRDTGYLWFMAAIARPDPAADAAAISIVYVALTVLYVSFGGLLFIFRRRRPARSPKGETNG